MDVRYTVGKNEYKRMTTEELRNEFLVTNLFGKDKVTLVYCEVERAIIGSAVPTKKALELKAGQEMAADYFCERRELGVINIGGEGVITVDGKKYPMANRDCLYVGRGAKKVVFASKTAAKPAEFYLASYPAHTAYPTTHATMAQANTIPCGDQKNCNKRVIRQYIHLNGIKSCQLVMGFTTLAEGSIWNTMPAHTHERRTEVYLYFDVDPDAAVMHFMGPGDETRHLVVHNKQAVISPMWSIHSGAGTRAYTFIWAMGGENQVFPDMDGIKVEDLK